MMNKIFKIVILVSVLYLSSSCSHKKTPDSDVARFIPSENLERDFLNPPDYARARAYWWWLESNISKQGIVHDLTEMKKVGIKGAMIFDAGSSSYWGVTRTGTPLCHWSGTYFRQNRKTR